MVRAARPGGTVAGYVWGFAGERQFQRYFWQAATAFDPAAVALEQSMQFPLCHPEPLAALFKPAHLEAVTVRAIEVPAVFRDIDDYWQPYSWAVRPSPSGTPHPLVKSNDRRSASNCERSCRWLMTGRFISLDACGRSTVRRAVSYLRNL